MREQGEKKRRSNTLLKFKILQILPTTFWNSRHLGASSGENEVVIYNARCLERHNFRIDVSIWAAAHLTPKQSTDNKEGLMLG